MTIYFAGAIRGGSGNAEFYREIILHLEQFGTVNTRHLAHPETHEGQLQHLDDKAIYTTDLNELRRADLLVAEVSTPSLGVGYKIAKTESFGIEALCLYKPQTGRPLSALVAGNSHITLIQYTTFENLKEQLTQYIKEKFPPFVLS